jgi:hypothetical protein
MTSSLTGKGTRRSRRRRFPLLLFVSIGLIAASVGLFVIELIQFSQQEDRLPENLTVAGLSSGSLSLSEAQTLWQRTYAQPVLLYYNDAPIELDPSAIGWRTNWQTMLAEASASSETRGGFWGRFYNYLTNQQVRDPITVPLYADYQQTLLEQFLRDIASRYDRSSGTAGYDTQTLTTFSGTSGYILDVPQAMRMVDEALRDPDSRTVILPVEDASTVRPGLQTLRELIIAYLNAQNFLYDGQSSIASIFIIDLQSGDEVNILGDVAFSAASTIKLPILVDYYRYLNAPPSQEEAWLMANSLLCSRNSSSNLLMEISGGVGDVYAGVANVTSTAQYLGLRNTYLAAALIEGTAGEQFGSIAAPQTEPNPNYTTNPDPYNQTTAEDMGTLVSLIYDCANFGSGLMTAYPDGQITQNECRQMLELISANDLLRLLQGGLPAQVDGQTVRISHKNGWLNDMVGEAGVVYPPNGRDYVISVYLWEQTDTGFQDFTRLWPLVEGISRAAWNYFSPEQALIAPRTDLPAAAQECEGNYLPPDPASVNLNDIDAWRSATP